MSPSDADDVATVPQTERCGVRASGSRHARRTGRARRRPRTCLGQLVAARSAARGRRVPEARDGSRRSGAAQSNLCPGSSETRSASGPSTPPMASPAGTWPGVVQRWPYWFVHAGGVDAAGHRQRGCHHGRRPDRARSGIGRHRRRPDQRHPAPPLRRLQLLHGSGDRCRRRHCDSRNHQYPCARGVIRPDLGVGLATDPAGAHLWQSEPSPPRRDDDPPQSRRLGPAARERGDEQDPPDQHPAVDPPHAQERHPGRDREWRPDRRRPPWLHGGRGSRRGRDRPGGSGFAGHHLRDV